MASAVDKYVELDKGCDYTQQIIYATLNESLDSYREKIIGFARLDPETVPQLSYCVKIVRAIQLKAAKQDSVSTSLAELL